MNYLYWNEFVNTWRTVLENPLPNNHLINIHGWTNPNGPITLYNTVNGDYSLQYLPEPWWGNDGTHALNSVVVNYNPGQAGEVQHHNAAAGLFNFNNYASFANSEATGNTNHFTLTNHWHNGKRAARVFRAYPENTLSINVTALLSAT